MTTAPPVNPSRRPIEAARGVERHAGWITIAVAAAISGTHSHSAMVGKMLVSDRPRCSAKSPGDILGRRANNEQSVMLGPGEAFDSHAIDGDKSLIRFWQVNSQCKRAPEP